jgi:hypothetical protein
VEVLLNSLHHSFNVCVDGTGELALVPGFGDDHVQVPGSDGRRDIPSDEVNDTRLVSISDDFHTSISDSS